jgi:2-hydroxycyclohexanecarboxyl-CoA dehydrogenase
VSAAIVTGAGGAIGRAVASRLAREGRPVLLVDRAEPVASVRDELRERGATAETCVVDLADPNAPLAVRDAVDRLGGASVLINNAGITRDGRVLDMSTEDFRLVVRINLVAALRLAASIAPHLADGGAIVNVASWRRWATSARPTTSPPSRR